MNSESTNDATTTDAIDGNASPLPAWVIPALVVLGIVIALVSERVIFALAIDESTRLYYPPPHNQQGDPPEYVAAVLSSMTTNFAISYSIFGGLLLGACAGIAGLVKSGSRMITGAVLGLIIGAVALAGTAAFAFQTENRLFTAVTMDGLLKAVLINAAPFGCTALLAGIAASLLSGRKPVSQGVVTAIGMFLLLLVVHLGFCAVLFTAERPEFLYPVHYGIRVSSLIALAMCGAVTTILVLRPAKSGDTSSDEEDE